MGWEFPKISNCRFCFHHTDFELKIQSEKHPEHLRWWIDMEEKSQYTFGKRSILDRVYDVKDELNDIKCSGCTD